VKFTQLILQDFLFFLQLFLSQLFLEKHSAAGYVLLGFYQN